VSLRKHFMLLLIRFRSFSYPVSETTCICHRRVSARVYSSFSFPSSCRRFHHAIVPTSTLEALTNVGHIQVVAGRLDVLMRQIGCVSVASRDSAERKRMGTFLSTVLPVNISYSLTFRSVCTGVLGAVPRISARLMIRGCRSHSGYV
jgi:hypothetical protein